VAHRDLRDFVARLERAHQLKLVDTTSVLPVVSFWFCGLVQTLQVCESSLLSALGAERSNKTYANQRSR
jgi:hypothetical protein